MLPEPIAVMRKVIEVLDTLSVLYVVVGLPLLAPVGRGAERGRLVGKGAA